MQFAERRLRPKLLSASVSLAGFLVLAPSFEVDENAAIRSPYNETLELETVLRVL